MDDIRITPSILLPSDAVRFRYSRSGGKGGQNVNKVATKVELLADLSLLSAPSVVKERIRTALHHRMSDDGLLHITSQESRSQWMNRETAVEKLCALIVDAAVPTKDRIATKPTRSSRRERVDQKKRSGAVKRIRRERFGRDSEG